MFPRNLSFNCTVLSDFSLDISTLSPMIQRFSLSPSMSPLLSSFFIYLTRLTAFCPLLSFATLLRRSRCAHSLRLSRSPPPLKHLHNHDWSGGRVEGESPRTTFPCRFPARWYRGGSIRLAYYNATDSGDHDSNFSTDSPFAFPHFRINTFWDCNFGKDIQFLFFFFFYDISLCGITVYIRFACHFYLFTENRFCE